ncbi:L-threonylcarbamoyladenylate synthase [Roseateles koreensis]|uniref:Threonylcarbamoyl-AMP synthase n=1 Tax=Roseateles koreensis TaxID=2987526 RepID=A0ABT5KNV5_9BURK|nr:L-threonylcarbamoyladenylate synthase [Roseateles koreensis]MDC8784607.1 L-threonylcarbamoyladenylate synthase [Roseateles koreensis]
MLLDGHDPQAIAQAAATLAAGDLVALPTETVYGLGGRADDDAAVAKIFAAKGRPADHPLIVHVLDVADAERFAAQIPPVARRLMDAFWPGPLTVIVKRKPAMAAAAAGGQDSIGLRSPAHPVARALLAAARERGVLGVAAPSANRFGRVSPTQAQHVVDEFEPGLVVLDGGACEVGIESSIVDCSRARPVLLRPGILTPAQIEAAMGEPLSLDGSTLAGVDGVDGGPAAAVAEAAPRASGTLVAHYAPRAIVRLLDTPTLRQKLSAALPVGLAVYSRVDLAGQPVLWRQMPEAAKATAHELFAVLRDLDAAGAAQIWIELPPPDSAWDGVRDRLSRAAAAFEA